MYGKIQITGVIEVETGLHIGGSSAFAAIGAVDSPVIRDAKTNLPMIPGSSLKGKMRSLLARQYNKTPVATPDDDAECITILFGSAKKGAVKTSKILIADMVLMNKEEIYEKGAQGLTEVKFENKINRLTAGADPRQIERVIRGAKFQMDMIYEVTHKDDEMTIEKDLKLLCEGFQLLKYDYLGGSGSRGYGKVKISDLHAETVVGNIDAGIIEKCNEILEKFN